MRRYVFDTDTLSLYQRGHPVLVQRIDGQSPDELAITVITVEEQLSGWYREIRKAKGPPQVAAAYERLARSVKSLAPLQVLPYTEQAIGRYEHLKKQKLNIRKNDLRIAAIALENQATVISRNLRDFRRVPALSVEDWSV